MAVGNPVKPTVHEILHLNETLRLEALGAQQAQVVSGMIGDAELRRDRQGAYQGAVGVRADQSDCSLTKEG